MPLKTHFFLLILLVAIAGETFAQDKLDSHQRKAMHQTQELLKSPSARQKYINSSDKAQKVDKNLDQLVNTGQQKQEVYKLSSDIFGDMVKQNSGDINKMNELLQKASQDPEAFYRGLSSEQKAKIKSLADDLEPTKKPQQ